MNKQVKKLWLEALRSGEYEQGTGTLCTKGEGDEYKFCCLGVLCDIFTTETNEGEFVEGDGTIILYEADRKGWYGLLPIVVRDWASMPSESPGLLARMNDRLISFEAIADHIEAEL